MGAVRMCARSVLRHRVWGAVAVALLVGIAGGAVLAAAEGARRTDTAYPRLLDRLHTADVTILPRQFEQVDAAAIAGLPNVVQSGAISGFGLAVPPHNGGPAAGAGTDRVPFYRLEGFQLLAGRLPKPRRADEILLNETASRATHLRVGSVLHAELFNVTETSNAPPGADHASLFTPIHPLRVVGIGRNPDELVSNENQDTSVIMLTPAFEHRHHDRASYRFFGVRLRHGTRDVPAFQAALHRRYPNVQFQLQTLETRTATFSRAVQPYVDALWLFAAAAALAALFVVGQALVRLVVADGADGLELDALGTTRSQRAVVAATRAVVVVLAGGALAVLVALALSPLFPLGPGRAAEPDPGIRLDAAVLGGGFALLVVVLTAPVGFMAWRLARRARLGVTPADGRWAPSRAAERLARSGAPASAVSGVRFALQRDRRPGGASVVTTLFGLVVAVATIAAALTFGTSLDRLVTTPQRYGWNWGALVDTYDSGASPKLIAAVRHDDDLSAATVGRRGTIRLAGRATTAFGFQRLRGDVLPQVTEGRFPRRTSEVALGAQTLRDVDRSVGDTISASGGDGSRVKLRIVGRVVLPSLDLNGTYGLGEGVALTNRGVLALDPGADPSFFVVDLAPGATIRALDHRYANASALGPQRPGDIVAYARVRSTPLVLAGLLALLGIGVLTHLLVTSVRARRRELAILKTIGFARRQVTASVAWQATTLAALAVVVGIPAGLIVGRAIWRSFATDLGVGAGAVVPVVSLLAIAAAAALLANAIAAFPARSAARTQPALVLRSE